MKLEQLAQKAFNNFCKKTNQIAYWEHMPFERKLNWMQEIIDLTELICKDIKKEIKPVAKFRLGIASFEIGYNEGVRKEREQLKEQLNNLVQELQVEIDNFVQRESIKNKSRS